MDLFEQKQADYWYSNALRTAKLIGAIDGWTLAAEIGGVTNARAMTQIRRLVDEYHAELQAEQQARDAHAARDAEVVR